MTELASKYIPSEIESAIEQRWLEARAFHAEPGDAGTPYSIFIPPPNVTAALHMGHALNNTLQDILTRWHRMRGDNTMWMPGTDHAGIATQTIVDKRLQQEGQPSLKDYKKLEAQGQGGRDKFIEKVQAWKDEYEARITDQLKRMGCSCDWERQRFTMDPICARAVREAFFRLFKDGLIYRGKRLVNWDPVTQTALADDEVEMRELDGNFYYLRYPLTEPAGDITHITVATTRPETMLGDTAVAINPRDPRAAALRGKSVKLPIVGRVIPIIEDEYVVLPDPTGSDEKAKYSSGFLKVTPAHDPNDYEIGRRFNLPMINVMAPDGSISDQHGWTDVSADAKPLVGLSREEARKAIIIWFKNHGLMEDVKPYRHSVGHSYRSHVPVEPYLSDQWYVKVTDERLAQAALRAMAPDQRTADCKAATSGRGPNTPSEPWENQLRFYPDRYARTFQNWHENIRDWCISRQLWWGHRIPVWTRPTRSGAENQLAALAERDDVAVVQFESSEQIHVCLREEDASLMQQLETAGFQRDPDVLDTWFSSALWPLSTLGWPEDNPALRIWNPSNVLCTAREIITLWVSRMVMFNLYLHGRLPFTDVFIHAMIQDGHGQKMSKSLGNGVDPLDIIHTHGADAMRFTLASMTTQTQDVRMPVDMLCPHTGQMFTPKFVTTSSGHKVAAPIQVSPGDPSRKMVSSFGVASGQAQPTADMPLARNTSEKFDLGRNFANKLWNAVRFALSNLEGASSTSATSGSAQLQLADRWILCRLAQAIEQTNAALSAYDFKGYADGLYDFIWRDLCDWYIEAVKPTLKSNPAQQAVLAATLDATLRLLHPAMPFVTEALWARLNEVCPSRELAGLTLAKGKLLCRAPWPSAEASLRDEAAIRQFDLVRDVVSALRAVRTQYKVPPRQSVTCSIAAPAEAAQTLAPQQALLETLAVVSIAALGPQVNKPANAAVAVLGETHLYLHDLVDADAEKSRLSKRIEELTRSVQQLTGRLSNASYVQKAPPHLVDQTRQQLSDAQRELDALQQQLASL